MFQIIHEQDTFTIIANAALGYGIGFGGGGGFFAVATIVAAYYRYKGIKLKKSQKN